MKQYTIEQKVTAFVNRYLVYEAGPDGPNDKPISFVEQKRLAFREEVIFYADQSREHESFRVKAEKVMDVHGKFLVTDPNGNRIGTIRKSFKSSLIRSTWELLGEDDMIQVVVREKSLGLAVVRRLWGFIPFIGDLPFIFKYHFDFVKPDSEEVLARYEKTTRFYDHYRLEVDNDKILTQIGWQTLIAQCILLDALQGR